MDAKTKEPVVGADVMVYRKMWSPEWHGATSINFGHRWQKTDASGRFDFPGVRDRTPHRRGYTWRLEEEPVVRVMDERYGVEARFYRPEQWDDPVRDFFIAMEISGPTELEAICEPDEEKRVRHFCAGLYPPGAPHCVEVVREMRCPHE